MSQKHNVYTCIMFIIMCGAHIATVIHKNISNGKLAMDVHDVDVYLLTYKQKMHTVNLPIFAVAGVALTGYSHSLWYNEMALKLMHRGGERCTLIYLKYGAMKQRQPSDNNALGLGE